MDKYNDIYYRIIRSFDDTEWLVVTMQWFNEYDCDQTRFLNEEKYESEKEAEEIVKKLNSMNTNNELSKNDFYAILECINLVIEENEYININIEEGELKYDLNKLQEKLKNILNQ